MNTFRDGRRSKHLRPPVKNLRRLLAKTGDCVGRCNNDYPEVAIAQNGRRIGEVSITGDENDGGRRRVVQSEDQHIRCNELAAQISMMKH